LATTSAGVCTIHSSLAYSVIGPIRIASIRQGAAIARSRPRPWLSGLKNDTIAVVRMCVPRAMHRSAQVGEPEKEDRCKLVSPWNRAVEDEAHDHARQQHENLATPARPPVSRWRA